MLYKPTPFDDQTSGVKEFDLCMPFDTVSVTRVNIIKLQVDFINIFIRDREEKNPKLYSF